MQPGDTVTFGGGEWMVVEVHPQTDTIKLARPKASDEAMYVPMAGQQTSIRGQRFEEVEVTAEQLAREQGFTVRSLDDFTKQFGYGIFQPRQGNDIWGQLAGFGIRRGENSAMDAMVDAVQQQINSLMNGFEVIGKQAGPITGSFKSIADMMGDFTAPDDEVVRANRKAELDAQFTEPEGDGFFVFYRKPGRGPGVDVVFQVDGITFPPPVFTETVHRCDTIEDAWAFVDYLKDDEAGEAIAIREDSCVLFYRGDAGWEALTRDPVPDEYREE